MATLEKIRNKAGLIVAITIGLALLLFVIGDMLNSSQSLFTNSKYEIAEVAGKSISYDDFNRRVESLIDLNKMQTGSTSVSEEMADNIRNSTWDLMIEEYIMSDEYNKLGITVTGDELMDMIQGENPHPIVRQLFSNPQTGEYDKAAVYRFLQQVLQEESERRTIWLFYENEINRQRKFTKYMNLLSKGLYVNSVQANSRALENNKTYSFDYVVQRFNSIPDSSVTVSDKEIEEYYKNNKYKYQQEESRDIKYVTFEVVPSEEDYKAAEEWINNIKKEFDETEETKQFVSFQSDIPYNDKNFKEGELPETINDFMFQASVGDSYGPYFEDGAYKIAKLAEINYLPDSARAQHILLQATQQNYLQMMHLADSLKTMAEGGVDFATLARTNSSDGSAQEGGDLGWFHEGDMVKPFSDSVFYGKVGDIKIVRSQFGIHVVKITDQSRDVKKVQVGILAKKVDPSNATDQKYYAMASEFAGLNNSSEKFNSAAQKQNLNVQIAQSVKPLDKNVLDMRNARELVQWAYAGDEGDVSGVIKIDNRYVVALLDNVKAEGYTDINDIREEIKIEVRKEKKAATISGQIAEKLKGNNNLNTLAQALPTQVESAAAVRFTNSSVAGLGFEPKIIATAYAMEEGKISQPITGNNGVYVISLSSEETPQDLETIKDREQDMIDRTYDRRVSYFALESLKERANITDNRVKFF